MTYFILSARTHTYACIHLRPEADDRSEPHKSLPANPLLADPMYWNGYIEKVGTGTEDII
jgi:predicted HTH transcriptional regulator